MKKIPMLEKFAAQSLVEYDGELIFSKEKFAELIVRECISVMDNTAKEARENFTYMDNDVPTTAHQFEIRKHFGVEK